jgi:hypothetical protein
MVLAVVHKAIMNPKFNCRTLQKQLDWKIGSQQKGPNWKTMQNRTCLAPLAVYVFFWVRLYCIKPHENDHTKVRGVCDGSTHCDNTMVHGATYAPTPHQIDVRLQIALSELLGMYLCHADVTNAFTEADHPEQIYYMRCDRVFQDWWAKQHPDISLPPNADVSVLKNLQGHPEVPLLWAVRCHSVIIMIKFKNTTHALCLYYDNFNDEFVLFLRIF